MCDALRTLADEDTRAKFTVLDLADKFMDEADFPSVEALLRLLPNVRQLDISGCALMNSCATPLKELLLPKLDRVYVLDSELCMFSGKGFFAQLTASEVEKIIFLEGPCDLHDRLWMDMIQPAHFPAVVRAHFAYFADLYGADFVAPLVEELCVRPVHSPSNDPIDMDMFVPPPAPAPAPAPTPLATATTSTTTTDSGRGRGNVHEGRGRHRTRGRMHFIVVVTVVVDNSDRGYDSKHLTQQPSRISRAATSGRGFVVIVVVVTVALVNVQACAVARGRLAGTLHRQRQLLVLICAQQEQGVVGCQPQLDE